MKPNPFLFVLLVLLTADHFVFAQPKKTLLRTVVTTDGEVDDQDSFLRLLLYSNEFKLQALVYSSSQWHYKGDGKGTEFISEMKMTADRYGKRTELRWPGTAWMQGFIDKYAMVYNNLLQHDKNYPTPSYLTSIVKTGNINFEGEMDNNTEGSDYIKKLLLDDQPGPLYLQVWGGTNTIARALKSIEEEYRAKPQWNAIYKKVSDKAVLYTVLDQDATYRKYISINWPDIRVLYNADQFWCLAYPWPRVVPPALQPYLRGPFMAEHIKFNHGPLLASYFLWGDGKRLAEDSEHVQGDLAEAAKYKMEQYDFISEGDSPAFFYLLDVGLRSFENAAWGGWGGRMEQSPSNHRRWEDGKAVADYNPFTQKMDAAYPQTRWIDALQNDFAARADWCVQPFAAANHAPQPQLQHPANLHAQPGKKVLLAATAKDPDGNALSYQWWQYEETGSYKGKINLENVNGARTSFILPADAQKGNTIHVILSVTDNGSPKLTRYQRVIVTVN